jgi:hypothetical protein
MNDNMNHQAEDNSRLDDLFRQTLEGQQIEPSAGLWKGISRKLLWREITHFNFSNLPRTFWVAGGAAMVLMMGTIYLALPGGSPKESGAPVFPAAASHLISSSADPAVSYAVTASSRIASGTSAAPTITTGNAASSRSSGTASDTEVRMPADAISSEPRPAIAREAAPASDAGSAFITLNNNPDNFMIKPLPADMLGVGSAGDTIITLQTDGNIFKIKKAAPVTPRFFSISLGVAPEVAFYETTSAYTEWNYWLNMGLAFNISRFSLKTGAGLGFVYDDGLYTIDYKSQDVVGYFYEVVSYTVNPVNPAEITYNTIKSDVYDSVIHVADDRTRNRYTYLQVPLLLGYRILETSRLGLNLQAGPALSFLIATKEALPVIDYPNARIIKVDNETPDRVSTYWQLWLNLSLEYRLTKQISLFAEPYYRYYFTPVVQREGLTPAKPSAFGIGLGVQYNFGSKNK